MDGNTLVLDRLRVRELPDALTVWEIASMWYPEAAHEFDTLKEEKMKELAAQGLNDCRQRAGTVFFERQVRTCQKIS